MPLRIECLVSREGANEQAACVCCKWCACTQSSICSGVTTRFTARGLLLAEGESSLGCVRVSCKLRNSGPGLTAHRAQKPRSDVDLLFLEGGCGNTGVENEILKSQQRSDGACPDKCGSPIGASLCAEACWSSDVVPHNEPQPRLASGLASGQSEALRCDVTVDWCREVACCAGAQGSA